jgi:alpha-tubulin suppressor-like RCC1 family protein
MVADGCSKIIAGGGSVSDGVGFTAAIVDDGKLLMWGSGESGALGAADGSTEERSVPTPVKGLADHKVVHVACGGKHAAAITDEGRLYTWGTGFCGQLGHGSAEAKPEPTVVGALEGKPVKQVFCGETHSICLTIDGDVYTWGLDVEGQLGHGASGHKALPTKVVAAFGAVSAVSCGIGPGGPGHSAAISNGKLYTWGMGRDGQLGHGDTEPRSEPTLVCGNLADKTVVAVSCGATHTAALTDDGKVYTFGGGVSGQLGHGDKERQVTVPCWCCMLRASVLIAAVAWVIKSLGHTSLGHTADGSDRGQRRP